MYLDLGHPVRQEILAEDVVWTIVWLWCDEAVDPMLRITESKKIPPGRVDGEDCILKPCKAMIRMSMVRNSPTWRLDRGGIQKGSKIESVHPAPGPQRCQMSVNEAAEKIFIFYEYLEGDLLRSNIACFLNSKCPRQTKRFLWRRTVPGCAIIWSVAEAGLILRYSPLNPQIVGYILSRDFRVARLPAKLYRSSMVSLHATSTPSRSGDGVCLETPIFQSVQMVIRAIKSISLPYGRFFHIPLWRS
ncbi:hypothetical protein BD410DRAFT_806689 [Rickenella mellea]|uniref:Uncharacterized protein n=1 Tax=Rickenella mellea TaxID=50990 RepID=A0A4Y7PT51_9AGAM|nr:hypothetical protein BD410DRAFT_806689 [Rickenella mellea]